MALLLPTTGCMWIGAIHAVHKCIVQRGLQSLAFARRRLPVVQADRSKTACLGAERPRSELQDHPDAVRRHSGDQRSAKTMVG
jgi:hypothetical protein